ncbi:MAG: AAA family ATPase [Coriobacteriales bacterium]
MLDERTVEAAADMLERICDNIETVIVGKRESVELVVMALIAQGHVLLEDLPGTGKTSLVSALSRSVDCGFQRIQFTPDVMPSDVTGFSIYNQKTHEFEFRPGGVMSNLVLADEINRANAKTQAALLEAMEERQVTVDNVTRRLPEPFMVLATQNPIEQHGTYPLPEAQLDRFLIKLSMGYPQLSEEVKVVLGVKRAKAGIRPVASIEDVLALRDAAEEVYIDEVLALYAVQICAATRTARECACGASPRGSIALVSLARANALMRGRSYVIPDDIKYLAPYVLGHRIILTHEAKIDGLNPRTVIDRIVDSIAIPSVSKERL